jgi:hypothetical protein
VCVSPYDIATGVVLEVPWCDYDYVAFAYPDASFHFTAYSAEAVGAVLAFNLNAVKAEQFCNYA